jgi:PadR family transcriptional regulator, regulatory protein PadR
MSDISPKTAAARWLTFVPYLKKSQLAPFDVICLVAVVACGANAYGLPIQEEVEKLASPRRSIGLGVVYRTLDRLERKGLVSSWYGDATPERGGRAKRYFRVTAAGRESLQKAGTLK